MAFDTWSTRCWSWTTTWRTWPSRCPPLHWPWLSFWLLLNEKKTFVHESFNARQITRFLQLKFTCTTYPFPGQSFICNSNSATYYICKHHSTCLTYVLIILSPLCLPAATLTSLKPAHLEQTCKVWLMIDKVFLGFALDKLQDLQFLTRKKFDYTADADFQFLWLILD